MQASGSRAERIADHIKDEVSQLLAFEVKDPAVGLLTVTHVRMTSDMGLAHVYYTLIGDEAERRRTARALERATAFVRRRLAESLNMRRAPDVRFHYDENVERQERVETLLREIDDERDAREAKGAGDAPDTATPAVDDHGTTRDDDTR
ncbi:MAG: 30S ribosome-binding factor RbfA [Acidobacteria bacterium]|nr:30S ribosome-binding factor RbfA [Acidobacteriota bacterium]